MTRIVVSRNTEAWRAHLRQVLSERRRQAETSGVTFNNHFIPTDADSQRLLLGLRNIAGRNPQRVFRFVTGNLRLELTANEALNMVETMEEHIQASFDTADDIAEGIENGTILTEDEIINHPDWEG